MQYALDENETIDLEMLPKSLRDAFKGSKATMVMVRAWKAVHSSVIIGPTKPICRVGQGRQYEFWNAPMRHLL